MEPCIVILGGEFPLRERVLAGAIRAASGARVVTIAKSRLNPAIKFFDDVISADVMVPEDVVAAMKRHVEQTGSRPIAVIPMNDFVVRTGLAVAQAFGLPYNSPDTVEACRDKFLMKEVLHAAGLPVPRFAKFRTSQELMTVARAFSFPVVIKPGELAGSVGVIKVETPAELAPAYARCLEDIRNLGGTFHTREDEFVIEEYIPLENEVSVEVICFGNTHRTIAVTDKYLGEEPYFVEIGHSVPSIHNANEVVRSVAERACAALGIERGVAHVEMRVMPSGEVRLIEVGARTGGDCIMDLVERAFGVNPYYLHVQSYLGIEPSLPEHLAPRGLAAVGFLKADVGVIQRVTPPRSLPECVVNMQITAKPLDVSEPPVSWKFREGSVEFLWRNRLPERRWREHLQITQDLARKIFTVDAGRQQKGEAA